MAITPRTILSSPAPATVAVVSLYLFTVVGTAAYTSLMKGDCALSSSPPAATACESAAVSQFGDQAEWSEFAWVQYAYCYDSLEDSRQAIRAADEGLQDYPTSQLLYNLKGYHQIVLGEHSDAIDTLREGMERVEHQQNGVMANNLAWAGLFEPRQMRLEEARELYLQSLARSPRVCESLHTGLFVEFAAASRTHGLDRYDALRRFTSLRSQYEGCLHRLERGDWMTTVEIVGAAAVFDDVDNPNPENVSSLLQRSTRVLMTNFPEKSATEVCDEAMPMPDFYHQCVEAVQRGMRANRLADRNHAERNARVQEVTEQLKGDFSESYPRVTNCRF